MTDDRSAIDESDVVVTTEPREQVRHLTLNRPRSLNAVNAELIARLRHELDSAGRDPDCRAIVISGTGRGFCSGLDLNGYGTPPGVQGAGQIHTDLAVQRDVASVILQVNRLPKPVIVAINGPTAGFGLALACAADIRIASSAATFTTAFVRIGVTGCDLGVSWLLPRLVGAGRAHELILTARSVDATEAFGIGLVADIVEPEVLLARVDRTLDDLLRVAPLALDLTKQAMWLALGAPSLDQAIEIENRQQILVAQTHDRQEGLRSFLERRDPVYRNV